MPRPLSSRASLLPSSSPPERHPSPSTGAVALRSSSTAARARCRHSCPSATPLRRSPRLAAKAQSSSTAYHPPPENRHLAKPINESPPAEDRNLADDHSHAEDSDPADLFGLSGLSVLPIPDTLNIATAVSKHAEERRAQLLEESPATHEALIYYGATTAHIDALARNRIRPGRITFFGNESGLLFFRMPQPILEAAHGCISRHLQILILNMDLLYKARITGSTTYKGIGTQRKEGRSAIRPDPPRWAGNQFPTLVIEAGYSESLRLLHKDRDWWFDNSPPGQPRGDVRVVLLVYVERRTKRIIVEQWYRGQQSAFQVVVIAPHLDRPFSLHDSSHWTVQGAPMVIPFEHVFLRPPERRGDMETDFVLAERFFVDMGMQCWQSYTSIGE